MGLFYSKSLINFWIKKNRYEILPVEKFTSPPEKILVISNTGLGDTLLGTPALKSLHLSFPNAKIMAIIPEPWLPLISGLPYVNRIYPYKKSLFHLFSLQKELKAFQPDVAVILHGNSPEDIFLAASGKPPFILRHSVNIKHKELLSLRENPPQNIHVIEQKLFLLKKLGASNLTKKMEITPLINQNLINQVSKKFEKFQGKILVGFQVGASIQAKRWGIEKFVKLANLLSKELDCHFFLFGGREDKKFGEIFKKLYGKDNCIDFTGKLSLRELPYFLKKMSLLVTPDTGIMHLAIALQVPTVSLFAISDPRFIGPYQDLHIHRVIFKPEGLKYLKIKKKKRRPPVVDWLILVEEVYHTVIDLLSELGVN